MLVLTLVQPNLAQPAYGKRVGCSAAKLSKHLTPQPGLPPAVARLAVGQVYKDLDLVFATEVGTPLTLQNLMKRHFKPILKAAGLPESIRIYYLRHTCATLLLAAGENPKVVSERLGHSSIVLTLDVYSHVLPTMQKAAAEKLEAVLFG
jgi:integrase